MFGQKDKKIKHETQGKVQDLQYRIIGKDSQLLCNNFVRLITWLSSETVTNREKEC